jgi:non-ribosomal peptide synthetase component E (peptide arylation enzyme)
MIPDRVVVMRGLPKNANGKVDRKTLAAAVSRGEI